MVLLIFSGPKQKQDEVYDGADILLATVTKPDDLYPSPKEIAEAWKRDMKGNIRYFQNNQEWRIRTSEDDEIKKHLA